MLFQMLIHSIQCLLVTNPSGWLLATAGIILFALLHQLYFKFSGAWKVFSPARVKSFRLTNLVYQFFMWICVGGAFHLYRFPSAFAEMIWGFVSFFFSVMALYWQYLGMQAEKKELAIP